MREEYIKSILNKVNECGGFLRIKSALYPNGYASDDPFLLNGVYVSYIDCDGVIRYYQNGNRKSTLSEIDEKILYCIYKAIENNDFSSFVIERLYSKIKEESGHIKLTESINYADLEYKDIELTKTTLVLDKKKFSLSTLNEDLLETIYNTIKKDKFI